MAHQTMDDLADANCVALARQIASQMSGELAAWDIGSDDPRTMLVCVRDDIDGIEEPLPPDAQSDLKALLIAISTPVLDEHDINATVDEVIARLLVVLV